MTRRYILRLDLTLLNILFLFVMPSVAAASEVTADATSLNSIRTLVGGKNGLTVPCGWSATFDAFHPERPPQLIATPSQWKCGVRVKKVLMVKAAASLSMIYTTKDAQASIRVIALEAGSVGDTIRCRSSIDGAVLIGRISDIQTVQMLRRELKASW